jgi:hypothetical protein
MTLLMAVSSNTGMVGWAFTNIGGQSLKSTTVNNTWTVPEGKREVKIYTVYGRLWWYHTSKLPTIVHLQLTS